MDRIASQSSTPRVGTADPGANAPSRRPTGRSGARRTLRLGAVCLLGAAALLACSPVVTTIPAQSDRDTASAPTKTTLTGLEYYLPKINAKLTFTRSRKPSKPVLAARKALDVAKKRLAVETEDAGKARRAATLANSAVTSASDPNSPNHAELPTLRAEARKRAAFADGLEARRKKAAAAVATAQAKLDLEQSVSDQTPTFDDKAELVLLKPIPDTSTLLIARLDHAGTKEDDFKLGTTRDGLLQSASLTSDDKTGEIVKKSTDILIGAFKLSTGGSAARTAAAASTGDRHCLNKKEDTSEEKRRFSKADTSRVQKSPPTREIPTDQRWLTYAKYDPSGFNKSPTKIEIEFDPSNLSEVAEVNQTLCDLDAPFEINVLMSKVQETKTQRTQPQTAESVPGLLYRRPVPYRLDLRHIKKWSENRQKFRGHSLKTTTTLLPNNGPIAALPFETGACVQTKYDITFTDGMPTKRDALRPSEVLECLSVPLDIIASILALPSELIQLKVDYNSKNEELLESQTNLIKAQQALSEAQAEADAARQSATEAQDAAAFANAPTP